MSPILFASSSEGARETLLDDRLIFLLRSCGSEDRDILGHEYRQFGHPLLVLGISHPRHGHWALMGSGSGRELSGPTYYKLKLNLIIQEYMRRTS